MARLRAPLLGALILVLASCDTDSLTSENTALPEVTDAGVEAIALPDGPSAAVAFAGGVSFGTFGQPTSAYGSVYNGGVRIIYPEYLMRELAGVKARGGKIVLNLAGGQKRFTDSRHNFSLAKWKVSVDRYRRLNLNSYIKDGTIVGNFLIDEPNDKTNWNGKVVSQATLEAMAKYSKQIWPGMPTIVRTVPDYLDNWSGRYVYLDAAWAQYHSRFGDPGKFLATNVAKAKQKGLGLIVGMNILNGNRGGKMSASQVRSWGSALLNSSYPCAFLSWQYSSSYLGSSSMKDAMKYLSSKARNRASKSCRT
jgi:hypothetical protein